MTGGRDAGGPRRVLMTTDAVGGVWEYAVELARGLGRAGVHVVLACMGPLPNASQRAAVEDLGTVELHARALRLEWMEDCWHDVEAAGPWLLGLADGCDLVHLNGYAAAVLPFRQPKLVVAHSCVCSWWRSCRGEVAPASWDRYRGAVAAGLAAADCVVAPSAAMLASLSVHYGAFGTGRVIHNGRDLGWAGPCEVRSPETRDTVVFSAGRLWDEAKNAAALVRVAPRVPWPVRIAGARALDSDAADIEMPNVTWLGRLSALEMAGWLGRAAVYALPARYEPFGLSVLEAALSGCALVLGDIPSLRELWDGAAVFVPPDDDEALIAAIDNVATDADARRALAARAGARAQSYSAAAMTAHYVALYAELTSRASRDHLSDGNVVRTPYKETQLCAS